MFQVTWRAPSELVERVRAAAAAQGWSLNEYLTRLARAATDPQFAGDDVQQLRERLRMAGLLSSTERQPREALDPEAVAAARRRAGTGTALADLVVDGRR